MDRAGGRWPAPTWPCLVVTGSCSCLGPMCLAPHTAASSECLQLHWLAHRWLWLLHLPLRNKVLLRRSSEQLHEVGRARDHPRLANGETVAQVSERITVAGAVCMTSSAPGTVWRVSPMALRHRTDGHRAL